MRGTDSMGDLEGMMFGGLKASSKGGPVRKTEPLQNQLRYRPALPLPNGQILKRIVFASLLNGRVTW